MHRTESTLTATTTRTAPSGDSLAIETPTYRRIEAISAGNRRSRVEGESVASKSNLTLITPSRHESVRTGVVTTDIDVTDIKQ